MKKDPSLLPTGWKENLEKMNERDGRSLVPFKRWTRAEIKKVYTKKYVNKLFALIKGE